MKKLFSLLLVLTMAITASGCTGSAAPSATTDTTSESTEGVSEETEVIEEETIDEDATEIALNEELSFRAYEGQSTDGITGTYDAVGIRTIEDDYYGRFYITYTITNNTDNDIVYTTFDVLDETGRISAEITETIAPGESRSYRYTDYDEMDNEEWIYIRGYVSDSDGTRLGSVEATHMPADIYATHAEIIAAYNEANAEPEAQVLSHEDLNMELSNDEYGRIVLDSIDIYDDGSVAYTATATYFGSTEVELYFNNELVTTMSQPNEEITQTMIVPEDDIWPGQEIAHLGLPEDEESLRVYINFYDSNLEWSTHDKNEVYNYVGKTVSGGIAFVSLESFTTHLVTEDEDY